MNEILNEIRLSRAFTSAFYDAMLEGKIEAPAEVLEKFHTLKQYYDDQMNRELS
jgi:hypothetical protein